MSRVDRRTSRASSSGRARLRTRRLARREARAAPARPGRRRHRRRDEGSVGQGLRRRIRRRRAASRPGHRGAGGLFERLDRPSRSAPRSRAARSRAAPARSSTSQADVGSEHSRRPPAPASGASASTVTSRSSARTFLTSVLKRFDAGFLELLRQVKARSHRHRTRHGPRDARRRRRARHESARRSRAPRSQQVDDAPPQDRRGRDPSFPALPALARRPPAQTTPLRAFSPGALHGHPDEAARPPRGLRPGRRARCAPPRHPSRDSDARARARDRTR